MKVAISAPHLWSRRSPVRIRSSTYKALQIGSALHLAIPASEGGLKEDGFAMPEQLRAISHERLSRRLGGLRPKTLEELLKRCRVLLR